MKNFIQGLLAASIASLGYSQSYIDNIDKKVVDQQVQSFTDLARQLHKANQSDDSDACDKLDMVWNTIEKTSQEPNALVAPKGSLKDLLTFGNGSALRFWKIFSGWTKEDWAGKFASDNEFLGNEIRPHRKGHVRDTMRLTHRYGVNVKLSYIPLSGAEELGLTGHYAKRNDCVLGRLSSAVPTSVKDRFTPAISTKFFMDGANESQVLIAQHDIGGQSWQEDEDGNKIIDNNFYSKYLSNRLSFEKGAVSGVGAFSRFFYTAQYFSRHILGLDYVFDPRELQANHLAKKDISGAEIQNAKGPRFVWMVAPSDEVNKTFESMAASDSDFRRHFLDQNGKWKKGESALYHVYGSDNWTYNPKKDAKLIGKFIVNSDFVVSEAADVRLFFKHAIQYHKIPGELGEDSPYTEDYPYAEWTEDFFTEDCNLGVLSKEVYPVNLTWAYNRPKLQNKIDFSKGSLEGTFLTGAIANPQTVRMSRNKEWCAKKFIEERVKK